MTEKPLSYIPIDIPLFISFRLPTHVRLNYFRLRFRLEVSRMNYMNLDSVWHFIISFVTRNRVTLLPGERSVEIWNQREKFVNDSGRSNSRP